MKIVLTSNYANEATADILLFEHLHPWIANWMCEELQRSWTDPFYWPVIYSDETRLWRGMEELI